jgi:outer membrane usher protein FimD/PapC
MALQAPRAASLLLALTAAAAASTGGAARAQNADPFALPADLTAKAAENAAGPVLAEIEVDGQVKARLVNVEGQANDFTIDATDARAAGLPVAEDLAGSVLVSSLPVYRWSFDRLRQRLIIQLLRNNDGANFRDLSRVTRVDTKTRSLTALRIDYDLTSSLGPGTRTVGGLIDAALVRGNFAAASSFHLSAAQAQAIPNVIRLDSTLQLGLPRQNVVVTVGDFVSAGTLTQRAVRLGGIQVASNFDLRPDLVTMPLPGFSGNVAVPTSIDILTADQRYRVGDLEPGKFTLQNVPVSTGRGEISAVTTDALGREVVQTTRFYTSRDLLAPGLTGYAVNFGFVRRRYGISNDDYGEAVASAYIRRGLSPFLTVEGSAEGTAGLLNFGARSDFTLGNIALLSVEGRLSHDVTAGSGHLTRFAVESLSPKFGIRAGFIKPSQNYRDVASRLGDAPPPAQLFADIAYTLKGNTQLQIAYVSQQDRENERLRLSARRVDTLSGSFRTAFAKKFDLFAAGGLRRTDGQNALFASVGLSLQLGGGKHVGGYVSRDDTRTSLGGTFAQDDTRPGQLGYSVSTVASAGSQRVTGRAVYRARAMAIEAQAEEVDGRFAGRINARGTLLVAGGAVYARSQSGSSFALVRTGEVANVAIKLENQPAGRTNAKGRLLVDNLAPLTPLHVDVDSEKLPGEALVRKAQHIIAVPRRAVALVEMDVVPFRPVLRRIVDGAGNPLEAGSMVVAAPSGDRSMVGYDGIAEINALGDDRRLDIGLSGHGCVVDLPNANELENGTAPLVCRIETIAADEGDASRALEGKKVARRN